jgi:hypothetical protein
MPTLDSPHAPPAPSRAAARRLRRHALQVVRPGRAEEEQDRVERAGPPPPQRDHPDRDRITLAEPQPSARAGARMERAGAALKEANAAGGDAAEPRGGGAAARGEAPGIHDEAWTACVARGVSRAREMGDASRAAGRPGAQNRFRSSPDALSSAWCLMIRASAMNTTSSATLVARSATRSRLRATRISSIARVMVAGSSSM